jgi:hypothetical protein
MPAELHHAFIPLFFKTHPSPQDTRKLLTMSLYGMSAVNCTNYPPLQSNPDIDGIGVNITPELLNEYSQLFRYSAAL